MIFSSYEFLFLFMPIVLIGYFVFFARRGRVVFLTLMSYVFYGWWDYRFCGLLLASTIIDYYAGKLLVRASSRIRARRWLILSMCTNLAMLGFFKYYDLGATTVNRLAGLLGAHSTLLPLLHLVLPVGISFYTFQTMSYTIDLYRGTAKPARSLWDFACYVALFPQLVAGPIVRYHELAEQLVYRTHTWDKVRTGIALFIIGLAKKVLLADGVAPMVDLAFGPSTPGFITSWIGVLAYTMQIYFDFSGYSDMAIGLGLFFGFRFPQNFNSPYQSVSITDFWRRWHISLSSWLRDYLYIPLGGNRIGPRRTYVNLFIVMLLGGLWHGANWTFVIWGGFHGVMLAWERLWRGRGKSPAGWLPRVRTFILVSLAWVVFRAAGIHQATGIWRGLIGLHGWGGWPAYEGPFPLMASLAFLAIVSVIAFTLPNSWNILRPDLEDAPPAFGRTLPTAMLRSIAYVLLFVLCIGAILINSSSPFLYFQF